MRAAVWIQVALASLLGLALVASASEGCGDEAAKEARLDYVEFQVSAKKATVADTAWNNHLAFLNVFGVVPWNVSLKATNLFAQAGEQPLKDFLADLDAAMKSPAANLLLRLLAHWSVLIATELQHPEWAGDFFVALLNRPPMDAVANPDATTGPPLTLPQFLGKLAFEAFPSLRDLNQVASSHSNPVERDSALLALAFNGVNAVSGMTSGQYTPLVLANIGLQNVFKMLRAPHGYGKRDGNGTPLEIQFQMPGENSTRTVDLVQAPGMETVGTFCIPASKGTLPEAGDGWALKVKIDGAPLAGYLPLSKDLSNKFQNDLMLLERLLFPLLLESGAYQLSQEAQAVVGGQASQIPQGWIAADEGPERSGDALRDRAVAYAMASTIAIFPKNRAMIVPMMLMELMRRDATLTFGEFERIAREAGLPIYFIADPTLALGTVRAWPQGDQFENRNKRPTRVVYTHVGDAAHAESRLREWGLTPEANLKLLREETGLLVRMDPSAN